MRRQPVRGAAAETPMLHSPPRQSGRDAKRPAFDSACGGGAAKHLPAELLAVDTLTKVFGEPR